MHRPFASSTATSVAVAFQIDKISFPAGWPALRARLGLERRRRERHRARGTGLDAGKLRRGLRQHAVHVETGGDKLGIEALRRAVDAGGKLLLRRRDHAYPHIAQHDEAEQMHVVGCTGPGVIGVAQRVLHEPHRRLLEMAKGLAERTEVGLQSLDLRVLVEKAFYLGEKRHDGTAAVLAELASDQIERLNPVGALVD